MGVPIPSDSASLAFDWALNLEGSEEDRALLMDLSFKVCC